MLAAFSFLVLCWNIRYANPADGPDKWEFRRDSMVQVIHSQKPAIIGLQEVLHSQLVFLKTALPQYAFYGRGRDDGKEAGEYSPLAVDTTQFEPLQDSTLWLSQTPGLPSKGWDAALPRIATRLRLRERRSPFREFTVYNTHFDHIGKEARMASAVLLLHWMKEEEGPVILMGDFNAVPSDPPIRLLSYECTDVARSLEKESPTFNGFKEDSLASSRIDYFWLKPGFFYADGYECLHPKVGGRQVSDHYPIFTKLRFR